MAVSATHTTVVTSLLDQFRRDIEPHDCTGSKRFERRYRSVCTRWKRFIWVDLDWEGKRCIGKELHEIMFQIGIYRS